MRMVSQIRSYLLPHISRIFSAGLDSGTVRSGIFALCLALVGINIWMKMITLNESLTARTDLLSSPFSVVRHMQLGQKLHAIGNTKDAEQELAIANQFSFVLGSQSPPTVLQQKWNNESDRLNDLYSYWFRIVEEKPDYRDAYLTLASLARALNKNTEAVEYLHQAYILDPNLKVSY